MALPIRDQLKYWGIAAIVLGVVMWLMGDVILPFLVGGGIAYMLDPLVGRLQRLGMGRVAATIIISLWVVLVIIAMILAVIPTLVNQLAALFNAAPEILSQLHDYLLARFPELANNFSTPRDTLQSIGTTIQDKGPDMVQAVLGSAKGVINAAVFVVVVPVVAFYLLLDWPRMIRRIDDMLPRDHAPRVRQLAGEIDAVLAAFIRGQFSVCVILGVFYSVALAMVGLQFGLVVGAIAGAITFIPYIGSIVGGSLAIGLALFQFWGDWTMVGVVAGIFAFGQFMEGNIITPNLVGNSVGLHPVWLIFALAAFGTLFGFIGMLVAVPVAAAIGVLVRAMVARYEASLLYRGAEGLKDEQDIL